MLCNATNFGINPTPSKYRASTTDSTKSLCLLLFTISLQYLTQQNAPFSFSRIFKLVFLFCFVLASLVLQTGGADRENVPQIQTSLFVKQLIVGAFSYSHFEAIVAVILCL